MDKISMPYTIIGCVDGCSHRLPDTIESEILRSEKNDQKYVVESVIPHCERSVEYSQRRQEIYNRAFSAKDSAKNFGDGCRKFRKIADEFTKNPCPFIDIE